MYYKVVAPDGMGKVVDMVKPSSLEKFLRYSGLTAMWYQLTWFGNASVVESNMAIAQI